MQKRVQKWGGFLAGMVVPNIGAFIAWGLITAFFIATGWVPSEKFSALVGPMINYLLPILIGYTAGKSVYGHLRRRDRRNCHSRRNRWLRRAAVSWAP